MGNSISPKQPSSVRPPRVEEFLDLLAGIKQGSRRKTLADRVHEDRRRAINIAE